MRRLGLLLALVASFPAAAQGTFADVSSGALGASPTGRIFASAEGPGGEIYVAGQIRAPGGGNNSAVAMWDGASWRALGSGMGIAPTSYNTPAPIRVLAVTPDGTLYAGGSFVRAGGTEAAGVAMWDGTQWRALGDGLYSTSVFGDEPPATVWTMSAGADGSLYVTGGFDGFEQAGARIASRAARWDGAAWHALPNTRTDLNAITATADGTVYIGGGDYIPLTGGGTTRAIARLVDGAWEALPVRVHDAVTSLAVGPDGALVASGYYNATSVSSGYGHVARWTGTEWTSLGGWTAFNRTSPAAISVAPNGAVYAAGTVQIAGRTDYSTGARWDGTAWRPFGGTVPITGTITRLLPLRNGRVLATGVFSGPPEALFRDAAVWDGASWQPLVSGFDGSVSALAAAPDGRVYASGSFGQAGDAQTPDGDAVWDGASWQSVADSTRLYEGRGIVFGPNGEAYRSDRRSIWRLVGDRWEGIGWVSVADFGPYITSLAVAPDGTLYVGGNFYSVSGVSAANVARWDGASWAPLGLGVGDAPRSVSGQPQVPVRSLAVGADGVLYAAGPFRRAGDQPAAQLARWNGTAWSDLKGSFRDAPGGASAFAPAPDGSVYVGGAFSRIGDIEARNVARWDGQEWHALGTGLGGSGYFTGAYALALDATGGLVAGGLFDTAGDAEAHNLARWDGASWTPLGAGADSTVTALAVTPDGDLFVGGMFTNIGGVYSPFVAAYSTRSIAEAPAPSPEARTLRVGPNPARTHATAFVTTEAPAVLSVFDALGRLIARLDVPGGTASVALPVERLAPGVYVVRLVSGAQVQSAHLVVAR